jgi:hypothetical protein
MAVRAAVDGEHGERVGDRGDEQDEQVGDGGDSSQCTDHGSGDDSVRALCDGARGRCRRARYCSRNCQAADWPAETQARMSRSCLGRFCFIETWVDLRDTSLLSQLETSDLGSSVY